MDWITHIIFGLALARLAFMYSPVEWKKNRLAIILIAAAASLLPDIDILTVHRSELHAPLVLLALAGIVGAIYPIAFRPLCIGLLSHSLLDIFLFDNSRGTIRNVIDLVVTNDTAAGRINDVVISKTAAEGIMLLYPLSRKMYYILLTEQTYPAAAAAVLCIAAAVVYLAVFRPQSVNGTSISLFRPPIIQHPMSRIAVGGTFNPLHDGHKALLSKAYQLSKGGDLVIGLTSNELARRRFRYVEDYEIRRQKLAQFMFETFGSVPRIVRLDDPFGPTIDEQFDYLVVSPETEPNAVLINRERTTKGKQPIEIILVEYVLAWDGQPISSTRILNGEIDIHGNPVE